MHDLVDVSLLGCSKEVESAFGVALKEWFGVGDASVHMSLRCKIHHYPPVFQNLAYERIIGNIPFHESVTSVPLELSDVSRIASKPLEIHVCDSEISSGMDHMMDKVASDEPKTTGDNHILQERHLPAKVCKIMASKYSGLTQA